MDVLFCFVGGYLLARALYDVFMYVQDVLED